MPMLKPRSLKPLWFGLEKLKFFGTILTEFGRIFLKSRIKPYNFVCFRVFDVSKFIPTIKNSNKTLKNSEFRVLKSLDSNQKQTTETNRRCFRLLLFKLLSLWTSTRYSDICWAVSVIWCALNIFMIGNLVIWWIDFFTYLLADRKRLEN